MKIFTKYLTMILVALIWGVICSSIFERPLSLIISGVGGFLIGFFWDKIWNLLTNQQQS